VPPRRVRIPSDKTFLIVEEKLSARASVRRKSSGLPSQISRIRAGARHGAADLDTGGKGHSCGIYSFDNDTFTGSHWSRRSAGSWFRVQSSSNAGTFTNGMPMTSSMGCGIWGGNITNENISLKHYMNVTWVSRATPEDRPSEQDLFGEFYNSETFS
jgi:sulfoacetaldehyde dehydrogenase